MATKPMTRGFLDEPTNTVSYLVGGPESKRTAVIDAVLGYDYASGEASTKSDDAILAAAAHDGFKIDWVLVAHAHADHLSGADEK